MSDISKRLRASIGCDAINGDRFERSVCAKQMREAADELDRLRAENERLRVDAERYRWLRDQNRGMYGLSHVIIDDHSPPYFELKCEKDLDAAIDAALSKGW
jgi:chromosome segregation ATPase